MQNDKEFKAKKRGDSYQIRVSCGYDANDKQVIRTKSWKTEYAVTHFKRTTMDTMNHALKRIKKELGHLRLDKITTRTIKNLIQSLLNGDDGHKPLGAKSVKR